MERVYNSATPRFLRSFGALAVEQLAKRLSLSAE